MACIPRRYPNFEGDRVFRNRVSFGIRYDVRRLNPDEQSEPVGERPRGEQFGMRTAEPTGIDPVIEKLGKHLDYGPREALEAFAKQFEDAADTYRDSPRGLEARVGRIIEGALGKDVNLDSIKECAR
jgi:hypothetical protein